MKIALFVGGMGIGGVTTCMLDLGRCLTDAGHQPTVVACARNRLARSRGKKE